MPRYLTDGTDNPPALRVYLNLDHLNDLPPDSSWPGHDGLARHTKLAEDGFEGVQLTTPDAPPEGTPLPYCGLDRINQPEEADGIFASHVERGDQCLTLHVGWGLESDAEIDRLVEAVLAASDKHALPAFIETHRATITQDIWRTVEITKRFPEVRFNGDFSHYYCGQEMVYGGAEMKMDYMAPIFERVGFMHGRIASPGFMQAPIDDTTSRPRLAVGEPDYLADFREMWTRAMAGFLRNAGPGAVLIFAPELLSPVIYYARVFPNAAGDLVEESDRYQQALLYKEIARDCFVKAQARV